MKTTGRIVQCNKCWHRFRGKGASRVMRKMLFFFCPPCWSNRNACEELMFKATSRRVPVDGPGSAIQ